MVFTKLPNYATMFHVIIAYPNYYTVVIYLWTIFLNGICYIREVKSGYMYTILKYYRDILKVCSRNPNIRSTSNVLMLVTDDCFRGYSNQISRKICFKKALFWYMKSRWSDIYSCHDISGNKELDWG